MQADETFRASPDASPAPWGKTDIIGFLAGSRGYRSYLEIVTPTTGGEFRKIDRSRLTTCHRLMYRCPDSFDDGLNIDFRAPGMDTAECMAAIKARGLTYDIMLIDSFHEYAPSRRDLGDALALLAPGGTVVVHDCLPPLDNDAIISPMFVPGDWCGVSFVAYIDFVTQTAGIDYTTVDTDYGCGIIRKSKQAGRPDAHAGHLQSWKSVREDPKAALRLVHENKKALLHITSVDDFIADQKKPKRRLSSHERGILL